MLRVAHCWKLRGQYYKNGFGQLQAAQQEAVQGTRAIDHDDVAVLNEEAANLAQMLFLNDP